MKTIETIRAMIAENRETYRDTANATREAVKTLESIYRETIEKTPAETIAAYVAAVGHDMAVCVLASLVNRSAWDGRISRRCAEWAKAQENAWDEEAAEKLWIGSDRIHRAHLDQLAAAMMEYQPEEPAEETTEEPKEETPMFPNLTAAVNAHFDENAAKFAANLETITTGEALAGWYYRSRMTPAALRMAQETDPAEPLPAKVREKMVSRFQRENESDRQKYLHKLERAANAPELRDLTVCVKWAKSRTRGANPTATVTANDSHYYETTGHASGHGYDKESAAIASAMNANAAVLRILYIHAEKGGKFAYSVYTFAGLPYFDGGCGVSCFRNVFEGCGYEWRDLVHRKTFDSYMMTPANA